MTDKYANLRTLCEAVAEKEHESRKFQNRSVVMGVHLLVFLVRKFQFEHNQKVEDPDTVRRRFNELATMAYGNKLRHVGTDQEKFFDFKPNEFTNEKTHAYELQSCYVLNSLEDQNRILDDCSAADFEKQH